MKKIVSLFVLLNFVSLTVFADCDWSKIIKNDDGTYTYSKELHLCVGNLVEDSKSKDLQIADYKKALELKDLALTKTEQRVNLWQDTSFKMEDRVNKIEEWQSKNSWLYFGLGVVATGLSVWGASQLIRR